MTHKYKVVLAPGCYSSPANPVISRYRTLRAAVARARRSDRLRVEPADSSVCLYQAQSRQHGYPDTRPLRVCVAEAEAAELRRLTPGKTSREDALKGADT